ncbi:M23 family metallopeptidase [Bacillus horti]|uniref:Murein DD-endopeptidase MepM/ murein hydrolase activator NlpD n=1 Tax=Caldalkalibacillus horti TaxID=77523 RepID=A0ABT9W366_9BACI|nr:M23 family metallopeptidase [Bacillus horti]MDQ0167698.1 murein DD-endopeptidase MepM/ murein hydrolase activator NlpD [Bacillus horti]
MSKNNKWWTVQIIPHGKGDIQSYKVKKWPILILISLVLILTITGIGLSLFLWDTTKKLDARMDQQYVEMDGYIDENHELKLRLSHVNVELDDLQNNLLDLQRYIEEVQQLEQQIKELDDSTSLLQNEGIQRSDEGLFAVSSFDPSPRVLGISTFTSLELDGHFEEPHSHHFEEHNSTEETAALRRMASSDSSRSKADQRELTSVYSSQTFAVTEIIREQIIALKDEAKHQQSQLTDLKSYIEEEQYKALFIPSIPPSNGRVSSSFGFRKDPFHGRTRMHSGIDFAGNSRSPIYATAHGTVTFAGRNGNYGNQIVVNHGNGYTTSYSHLSAIDVEKGDKVEKGDEIGRMGSTGRSTGVHLHYELHKDGKAINPADYLR